MNAMAIDPSLRSRLREALQQSAAGRPRSLHPGAAAGADGEAAGRRDLPDERDDEHRALAEAEQARWIAETLGGSWERSGGGTCLVVDRLFPGDRLHGHCEIGVHAEAVRRYQQVLCRFDGASTRRPSRLTPGPAHGGSRQASRDDDGSLFSRLGDPPTFGVPVEARGENADRADLAPRLLFFDLETTGLSGGAGTCAFLIGYGWFEGDAFRTRQYFLGGYGHEPALLRMAVAPLDDLSPVGQRLVTFNGRTFDVPLIQGRYLFHRLPSPFDAVPHIDLLHPARRLWRYRASGDGENRVTRSRPGGMDPAREEAFGRYFRASARRQQYNDVWSGADKDDGTLRHAAELGAVAASCALGVLEEDILGFRRTGDVPGAEIPARYFHYARTGDVRPLESVLEHNRLDLVSLAALASVIARMVEEGPRAARTAHECLALGRLYERTGAGDRAAACYERIVDGEHQGAWRLDAGVECEALRRLALGRRRERRHDEAAQAWQRLLDLIEKAEGGDSTRPDGGRALTVGRLEAGSQGEGGSLFSEAAHRLAVYHEHRSRNLETARALVARAIDATRDPHQREQLKYRLARIERKMSLRRGDAT
jgi:uncharacterized protein YprB with RNaseH-like and TPR domain